MPVYYLMGANFCNDTGKEKYFQTIVQFESEEQFEMLSGDLFDTCHQCIQDGVPKGWNIDEMPEPYSEVTEEEAKEKGFRVFYSDK
jgi:hypothetical protein